MITKYYLNQDILPTIPTPHDCLIDAIECNSGFLIFKFEKNISRHDSIKCVAPNADSLIIKMRLLDSAFDVYQWKRRFSLGKGKGFALIDHKKVFSTIKKLEYLSHYVAYNSIIIELFQFEHIVLKIETDFIEFEWIEK